MSKYTIDDIELAGVTTILGVLSKGDGLKQWAVNCAIDYIGSHFQKGDADMPIHAMGDILTNAKIEWKNVSTEAKDTGTDVHHWIKDFILNPQEKIQESLGDDKEFVNCIRAFLTWKDKYVKRFIKSEHTVSCLKYGYAGTLDFEAEFKDGKIYLGDFKTCSLFDKNDKVYPVYPESIKQIAAYKYADEDREDIDGMGIVRLNKGSEAYDWTDCSEKYEKALQSFLNLCEFYFSDKKRRLKNNPMVKKYYK